MVKIYTKKGDQGRTCGPIGCGLVYKDNPMVEAVGSLDELSAHLGLVIQNRRELMGAQVGQYRTVGVDRTEGGLLQSVQKQLLRIGGGLYTGRPVDLEIATRELERLIDKMDETLAPLQNFIVPHYPADIHVARAVCRRAERDVVKYQRWLQIYHQPPEERETKAESLKQSLVFLNRFSDYLFTLARFVCKRDGFDDVVWEGTNDTYSGSASAEAEVRHQDYADPA